MQVNACAQLHIKSMRAIITCKQAVKGPETFNLNINTGLRVAVEQFRSTWLLLCTWKCTTCTTTTIQQRKHLNHRVPFAAMILPLHQHFWFLPLLTTHLTTQQVASFYNKSVQGVQHTHTLLGKQLTL